MTEETKNQFKIELQTRQSSLKDRERDLETHLAWAQSFRKEVVETRDSHLVEVDQRMQSIETDLMRLKDHRKEVVETRDRALAEVDQKIQSITEEINACRNELLEIADLQLQATTKE